VFGVAYHVAIVAGMTLDEELAVAGKAAGAHAEDGEELVGVVPTEPGNGVRVYLCAYARGDERSWLALDRTGRPIADRTLVRDAVSIAAMCELAEESAGGAELQQAIVPPPRVASVAYLDAIGLAAARLEETLGDVGGSPFAEAMKTGVGAADELAREVVRGYKGPLT
jgi:hypothetical protein